ncbi:MAG: peptidase M14 [Candidatus Sumerlaeia bacterium]|nr:peptidase M14 [Candidatus Sumerlaeia bacterium]
MISPHHVISLRPPVESVVEEELNLLPNRQCRVDRPPPGRSRNGIPIHAVILGDGPLRISITAGAHADEPGGPLAALQLCHRIVANPELHKAATWVILPHVNPDGARANEEWFRPTPDIRLYAGKVQRDKPGDDVEFNYPEPPTISPNPPRPENLYVAGVLRKHGPYDLHFSLHGMALAEGAWWLICREWMDRTQPLRERLKALFAEKGFGLHDTERRGEKGFHRIEKGFCTTPTATGMIEYFTGIGDDSTAKQFLSSSMEYVRSLGGDPLAMVSELPLFQVSPEGYAAYRKLNGERANYTEEQFRMMVEKFLSEHKPRPTPFRLHVDTLCEAIEASLVYIRETS